MNKIFLLILCSSCIFIVGCSQSNLGPSKIVTTVVTDTIMDNLENNTRNEISYTIPEDYKKGGWKLSSITGYSYRYMYDDLGIILGIKDPYIESFYTLPDTYLFERKRNKVFDPKHTGFFVEMLTKSTGEELGSLVNQYVSSGCIAQNFSTTSDNGEQLLTTRSGIDLHNAFEILSIDGCFGGGCACSSPDIDNPEAPFGIYYVQSKYHDDRYYKISYPAACAPTCETFTYIELF